MNCLFPLTPLIFIIDKNEIPGPNLYNLVPTDQFKPKIPGFKIGERFKYPQQDANPPKQIRPPILNSYKRRAPAYHMGIRPNQKRYQANDGYDEGFKKKNFILRSTPAFSMGKKLHQRHSKTSPAYQNLCRYDPYPKGPAFSFGLKHSEFIRNPITYCDNL